MGYTILELEESVKYISQEIIAAESISCPVLRNLSIRYLSHLCRKAMNKLAKEKSKALQ